MPETLPNDVSLTIDIIRSELKLQIPRTPEEYRIHCERKIKKLGSGAYREVYALESLPLVLKFPHGGCSLYENILHARNEYQKYNRIMNSTRKYVELKKYMPVIYDFNDKTGVMLMHKYKCDLRSTKKWHESLEETVCRLFRKDPLEDTPDVHNDGNLGIDEFGQIKILDLGLF